MPGGFGFFLSSPSAARSRYMSHTLKTLKPIASSDPELKEGDLKEAVDTTERAQGADEEY